jgi:pectin methylesterase-like acyl-CoA thioesterase
MSRVSFVRLFSVLALTFAARALFASTLTYEVGTCMPGLPSFPTISAALAATPPANVVGVCPGTYNEQVHITQPVTLKGVSSADSAQAIIAPPAGGLVTNANLDPGMSIPVAAQIQVDNASGASEHQRSNRGWYREWS